MCVFSSEVSRCFIRITRGTLVIVPFCICAIYVSFHHLSGHGDRMRAPVFADSLDVCCWNVGWMSEAAGSVSHLKGALVMVNTLLLR